MVVECHGRRNNPNHERRATERRATSFSPETPWLVWDKWSKGQCYKTANPPWFKQFTRLWTDPHDRAVWDVEGQGQERAALLFRLTQYMAVHSAIGCVWGDPVMLQLELRTDGPPDVSWLVEAGWLKYISNAEKIEREHALTERGRKREKTAPTASKKRKTSSIVKHSRAQERGEERRGETEDTSASVRAPNQRALKSIRVDDKSRHDRASHGGIRQGKARQSKAKAEPETKAQPEPRGQAQAQQRPVEARRGPQNPNEPEGGGRQPTSPRRRTAAPRASLRGGSEPVRLGDCLALHWADTAAVAFGRRIVQELWPGRDLDTDDAASEVGCFAKWYIEARARSPNLFDNGFVDHCAQKARHIAKYGKSARRRGAVLRSLLNKSVMSHGP